MSAPSRAPVDSTDAREQRELDAAREAAEAREAAAAAARAARRADAHHQLDEAVHQGRCTDGWLGEDEDGRPVPCRVCRPHLSHVACRTCSSSYKVCEAVQTDHRQPCCDDCDHAPAGAR